MEAHLSNHCSRGRTVSITYSEFGTAERCFGNTTLSTNVDATLTVNGQRERERERERERTPKQTLQYEPTGRPKKRWNDQLHLEG
jgi:hypothetical protein